MSKKLMADKLNYKSLYLPLTYLHHRPLLKIRPEPWTPPSGFLPVTSPSTSHHSESVSTSAPQPLNYYDLTTMVVRPLPITPMNLCTRRTRGRTPRIQRHRGTRVRVSAPSHRSPDSSPPSEGSSNACQPSLHVTTGAGLRQVNICAPDSPVSDNNYQ
jgi:hypothetical protein